MNHSLSSLSSASYSSSDFLCSSFSSETIFFFLPLFDLGFWGSALKTINSSSGLPKIFLYFLTLFIFSRDLDLSLGFSFFFSFFSSMKELLESFYSSLSDETCFLGLPRPLPLPLDFLTLLPFFLPLLPG